MRCRALNPPGSVARTVTSTPTATAASTVNVVPETATATHAGPVDTAEYASSSPSGSLNAASRSNDAVSPGA